MIMQGKLMNVFHEGDDKVDGEESKILVSRSGTKKVGNDWIKPIFFRQKCMW